MRAFPAWKLFSSTRTCAFDPGHGVFFENSRTGLEVIAADVVIFDQLSDMDAKIDNPCFDLVLAD